MEPNCLGERFGTDLFPPAVQLIFLRLALHVTPLASPYRSNSAAITLMLPRIATTSLTWCPSISFGNT